MAIIQREQTNKRIVTEDTKRIEFEELLKSLGFQEKLSKINLSNKMWSNTKISYIYIFTRAKDYNVRLFSADNSCFNMKSKEYKGEKILDDILNDQ